MGPPTYMGYAPENGKEVFDLGELGFAYINIFIMVNEEEIFDLRGLGLAYYSIFITVNDKEDLEMRVLGRGRAGHFTIYHDSN